MNEKNLQRNTQINHIAKDLFDSEQILSVIQSKKRLERDIEGNIAKIGQDETYMSSIAGSNKLRADRTIVPPLSLTEKKLTAIWAEFLGFEQISIHDDFFELGGDSLLAVRILSRVREAFQIELTMDTFFTTDVTVAGISKIIESQQINQSDLEVVTSILQELDGLTDEEVRVMLANDE